MTDSLPDAAEEISPLEASIRFVVEWIEGPADRSDSGVDSRDRDAYTSAQRLDPCNCDCAFPRPKSSRPTSSSTCPRRRNGRPSFTTGGRSAPSLALSFPSSGPRPPAGSVCFKRRHAHEKNYANDPARNDSYREAAWRLAAKLEAALGIDERVLVYAPLRGAGPIWRAVSRFLPGLRADVYHPVTSSFVSHSIESGIRNAQGRPASGRFNHILELKRLRPFLSGFRALVYADEIVSGGMMAGYVQDMLRLGLDREVRIVVCGLADDFGQRSEPKRRALEG